MNKNKFIYIALFIMLSGSFLFVSPAAKADTQETAALRILTTGDLHGQVTAYNYETNQSLSGKGLSKLSTLISQETDEAGSNNTLLLDAGDFLYDYTSNFFYDNYRDELQPIMKAISIMNYDYITLGNHEFDYPWDYLKNQLDQSGLSDKVLVCNTVWHDSGKQVFAPSAIVTKYLSKSSGGVVAVKIGIIGSTTNSISARRGDYYNFIDAQDNYESILKEADRLKAVEKVDAVIVILHGGIGTKAPITGSDNIGFALTKSASIDAVITAHTHNIFPEAKEVKDLQIPLKYVDLSTGRINGKPVVEASSHAGALGVIDLTFSISSDGTVSVSGGKSGIDYITDNVKEDSRITDMFSDYKKQLEAGADVASCKLAKGITYNNYDTVLQDSNLYQLLNNAKIDYGLTYISEYMPENKGVPVIACTRNILDSNENYLLLKDSLSSDKVAQILSEHSSARPSGYIQMFKITGKTLREWLEYNASMYADQGTTFRNILKSYVIKNPGISTLLKEDYVYNWSNQYVFDGISYTVDLSKKARYSSDGVRLNSTYRRITSLTYNGAEIADTQQFILVADTGIPPLSFLPKDGEDSMKEIKDYATGKDITMDYIKKLSLLGNISVQADHNWSLTAGKGYSFLLGVPKSISGTVSAFSWNKGLAAETTSYSFYKGVLPTAAQSINIIAAQGRTEMNNEPVPVIISASSKYAVKEIRYLEGKVSTASDPKWSNAALVKNYMFETEKNGIYSIKVTDKNNKSSIAYIMVDRYNTGILPGPKLDPLTNRFTAFTGKSVPYSTLHVTIGSDSYSATVKGDGTFKITIKPPKAFSTIAAYTQMNGLKSEPVTAGVRKTGPDAVQISTVRIGDYYITGTASPDTFVYALIWTTIYVGRGQTQAYKDSDFYKSTYKIVETDIVMDPRTGEYTIPVPFIQYKMNVRVYCVDRFGTTSMSTMRSPI